MHEDKKGIPPHNAMRYHPYGKSAPLTNPVNSYGDLDGRFPDLRLEI
jgi:hypothetical protein